METLTLEAAVPELDTDSQPSPNNANSPFSHFGDQQYRTFDIWSQSNSRAQRGNRQIGQERWPGSLVPSQFQYEWRSQCPGVNLRRMFDFLEIIAKRDFNREAFL